MRARERRPIVSSMKRNQHITCSSILSHVHKLVFGGASQKGCFSMRMSGVLVRVARTVARRR
jgi:hypothetical protein